MVSPETPQSTVDWTQDPRFGDDDVREGTLAELEAIVERRAHEIRGQLESDELTATVFRFRRDYQRMGNLLRWPNEWSCVDSLDDILDAELGDDWNDYEEDNYENSPFEVHIYPITKDADAAAAALPWSLTDCTVEEYWRRDKRWGRDDDPMGSVADLLALFERRLTEITPTPNGRLWWSNESLFRAWREHYRLQQIDEQASKERRDYQRVFEAAKLAWEKAKATSNAFSAVDAAVRDGMTAAQLVPWIVGGAAGSWDAVDLDAIWDKVEVIREPDYMLRSDKVGMFYRGLTHDIHGESESGKSFIVQAATVERLEAGELVLYIDFERSPNEVLGRLRTLGMRREHLAQLTYVRPRTAPDGWLDEHLGKRYALAVLDGVTASYNLLGLNGRDEGHAAKWNAALPARIALETGAAVVQVDHEAKGNDGRFMIGSQHKMSAITGTSFAVDVARTLGQGKVGELRLFVGKDSEGGVRAHAGPENRERLQPFARFIHDATNPAAIKWSLEPWTGGRRISDRDADMDREDSSLIGGGTTFGADWADTKTWALPADVLGLKGRGARSVPHIAAYMRTHAADRAGTGESRLECITALRKLTDPESGEQLYPDDSVIRHGWSLLVTAGRLKSRTADSAGASHWVVQADDPQPVGE